MTTCGVGDALENFVSLPFGAADVGADGVDDGFGALSHLDGFFTRDVALVVVAITEQDDGPTNRLSPGGLQKLIATGEIQRIIHSGAAARTEIVNAVRKSFCLVREVLGHLR